MSDPTAAPSLTYARYLRLDELLRLQSPRSSPAEHDETLFIVIHQVYELWFKQILHETGLLIQSLERAEVDAALATFKRVLTILKTLVAQIDVLETMTPVQFASFRTRLEAASGFQSYQFRAVELLFGKHDPRVRERFVKDPEALRILDAAAQSPSLHDAFLRGLLRLGATVPQELVQRPTGGAIPQSAEWRTELVRIYRGEPEMRSLCERMVDLDEGVQEWRYRHVKMVERTIGWKRGTGGSAGAEYLRSTLFQPMYPDLWAIRSEL